MDTGRAVGERARFQEEFGVWCWERKLLAWLRLLAEKEDNSFILFVERDVLLAIIRHGLRQ